MEFHRYAYHVLSNYAIRLYNFNDGCLVGRLGQESLQSLHGTINTHCMDDIGTLNIIQTHQSEGKLALEESQQQK